MVLGSVEITLKVYTCKMKLGAMSPGWVDWRADQTHGLCAPSTCSVVLTAKSENRNGNCDRGCDRELISKKSSLSG